MLLSVMIVIGGGIAFSSDRNIKDMKAKRACSQEALRKSGKNHLQRIQRIPLTFYQLDVSTIAAVNGPAIGVGCDPAWMCDIRIAAESATFDEASVPVELVPGDGGGPSSCSGRWAFRMPAIWHLQGRYSRLEKLSKLV